MFIKFESSNPLKFVPILTNPLNIYIVPNKTFFMLFVIKYLDKTIIVSALSDEQCPWCLLRTAVIANNDVGSINKFEQG